MGEKIRIFLADDHAFLRSSLVLLLEQEDDLEVVGEAGTCEETIRGVLDTRPDLLLIDISFPDCDGVEALSRIHLENPGIKIAALTMHMEEAYLMKVLNSGGAGYIHKSVADRDLITAIRDVMAGKVFLRPEGVQVLAKSACPDNILQKEKISLDVLSDREQQVLALVARGFTCKEIGERLFLSSRTVETYRERIMTKLQLEHRFQLVDYAIEHRLLEKDKQF